MEIIKGFQCNIRGFLLGMKTGKLLIWGILRFFIVLVIMILMTGLILSYHGDMTSLLWEKPESAWLSWLWHLVSWLIGLLLIGISAVLSYLISQILFSAMIMDHMSRITEQMLTNKVEEPEKMSFWKLFLYLVRQEIPRAIIPLLISLFILIIGWIIVLGPVFAVISSLLAISFLSWDNTDLVPARRMVPFKKRFNMFLKNVLFHIGFGIPFLVPGLNILLLSFAPVGATIYFVEKQDGKKD